MVIVLFFRCMVALFDPDYRRGERIRWGLVSYTMAMFLLVTIGTATQLNAQSIAYIDDRQFHGAGGVLSPGPIGYLTLIASKPISVIQNIAFALNNWLADGFLVSPPFWCCVCLSRWLTPTPPAPSLLYCLLYEPLGHCFPLPPVSWFVGYALEFSKNLRKHSVLTCKHSGGYRVCLSERANTGRRRCLVYSSILFDLTLAQHPHHPYDCCPVHPACQEYPHCPRNNRDRRVM